MPKKLQLSGVIAKFRNIGIGSLELVCLSKNAPALRLYFNSGFYVLGSGLGFNGFAPDKRPAIFALRCYL